MIEPTLSLAAQACFWFAIFYIGRDIANDEAGYFKKYAVLFVVGWIIIFAALALDVEVDASMTSQEVGQLGLYLMAFFGSSIIGGYRFEKWRKKRRVK